jgi:hypothetical protein
MTRHRTVTGRTCSTCKIQREVSQAQGQSGSNQKSAVTDVVDARDPVAESVTQQAYGVLMVTFARKEWKDRTHHG